MSGVLISAGIGRVTGFLGAWVKSWLEHWLESYKAGIGLFVSRAVAEAHGCSLTLESAPGRGTTAILELPIASAPLPPHFTTGRSGGPP